MTVRHNFSCLMNYVAEKNPDLLVITGDLPGEDGSREAYEFIRQELPDEVPCMILPGNHDDPVALFEMFQGGLNRSPDFFEKMALEEIDLLFANTESTWLPEEQVAALKDPGVREGAILFLHHPTEEVSGGFMDVNYPLRNRDEVAEAIRQSNIDHVFCGHFHTEFIVENGYRLYVTPSPAFDVDRESVEIKIGPPRIPLREIVVDGKSVSTEVIYLDE